MAHQPTWRPDRSEPTSLPEDSHATPLALGPEWSEENSGLYLAELAATLANHGGGEGSSDLALDLLLNEIVEQARLATTATGAAIAMARGSELVCRATTGDNAPDLGVRLNTLAGLSGACVQTGQVQRCDDTEIDPRVDALACLHLNVRSILVVPVIDEDNLVGVFEIFSPRANAFSDRDSQTLQALSRRIVESIHTANHVSQPPPETQARPSAFDPGPSPYLEDEPGNAPSAAIPAPEPARDYWTTLLTALVIVLALVLGWVVGRESWQQAVSHNRQTRVASTPPAQAARPEPPPSDTVIPASPSAIPPAVEKKPLESAPTPASAKTKTDVASSGDLAVYDNGKLVFQMSPAKKAAEASAVAPAVPGDSATASTPPVSLSSDAASAYLLTRIEPEYPEDARQQHVQGPVVLDVVVGKEGTVRSLTVNSGEPRLAAAAADAVRQWRFKSFHRHGVPVEFETRITVNFTLP